MNTNKQEHPNPKDAHTESERIKKEIAEYLSRVPQVPTTLGVL